MEEMKQINKWAIRGPQCIIHSFYISLRWLWQAYKVTEIASDLLGWSLAGANENYKDSKNLGCIPGLDTDIVKDDESINFYFSFCQKSTPS
jgi:hypothetical protein